MPGPKYNQQGQMIPSCTVCGSTSAEHPCPGCKAVLYCAFECLINDSLTHEDLCNRITTAVGLVSTGRHQLLAHQQPAQPHGSWFRILDPPTSFSPVLWPAAYQDYRHKVSTVAAYLVHAGSAVSLKMAIVLYSQVGGHPFFENRAVNRVLPALYFKLGHYGKFIECLLHAFQHQLHHRPQQFDIVNSPLPFRDIGSEILLVLAKVKVLNSLKDARKVLLLDRVLPPEMILEIQKKELETYHAFADSIQDLTLQLGSRNGLDKSINKLDGDINASIQRINAINPSFLVGFFWTDLFIRLPVGEFINPNNPNSLPSYRGHMCYEGCHTLLGHMAQLTFTDIYPAFDGDSLELMRKRIYNVVPDSIDRELARVRNLFQHIVLPDPLDAVFENTLLM